MRLDEKDNKNSELFGGKEVRCYLSGGDIFIELGVGRWTNRHPAERVEIIAKTSETKLHRIYGFIDRLFPFCVSQPDIVIPLFN